MNALFFILVSTFLISLISFVGIITLFLREKVLNKILLILVVFSAGSLLGGAFFHLIPEAIEKAGIKNVFNLFLYLILGFCIFFILENFINWHHHHAKDHPEIMPFSYLILVSDGIHNFIDGLIIAASFVVAFPIGVVTVLAVAIHEIPQEIGDFGVLVYGGFKKIKALFLNFLSAIFAIFGGIFGYLLSEKIGGSIIFLLSFAAGNFIYISASDLLPEIKQKVNWFYFFVFLSGIGIMFLIRLID